MPAIPKGHARIIQHSDHFFKSVAEVIGFETHNYSIVYWKQHRSCVYIVNIKRSSDFTEIWRMSKSIIQEEKSFGWQIPLIKEVKFSMGKTFYIVVQKYLSWHQSMSMWLQTLRQQTLQSTRMLHTHALVSEHQTLNRSINLALLDFKPGAEFFSLAIKVLIAIHFF